MTDHLIVSTYSGVLNASATDTNFTFNFGNDVKIKELILYSLTTTNLYAN
jgi:hypothetical protein